MQIHAAVLQKGDGILRLFGFVLIAGCLLTLCLKSAPGAQEAGFVRSESYTIADASFTKVTGGDFRVLEIDSVAGVHGCRYVISSGSGVVYLDATGRVISSVIPGERELISVSSDASKIARLSWSEMLDHPLNLRVESADGQVLWSRDDGYGMGETAYSAVRVTPQGYAIVAPNMPPPELQHLTKVKGNLGSPLILDDKGHIVAKLPVVASGGPFLDALSPDGDFYAINFIDTEAGAAEDMEGGLNCVALFQVETGEELWRYQFGHSGFGCVAVGPEARVVVAAGRDQPELEGTVRYGDVLCFFDKQGRVFSKRMMSDRVRHLTLSPNGAFAAMAVLGDVVERKTVEMRRGESVPPQKETVSVRHDSLFMFDTTEGHLVYSLAPKPLYASMVRLLAVVNDGICLATSTFAAGSMLQDKLVTNQLISQTGSVTWEKEWEISDKKKVRYGLTPDGSRMIQVDSRGTVVIHGRQ